MIVGVFSRHDVKRLFNGVNNFLIVPSADTPNLFSTTFLLEQKNECTNLTANSLYSCKASLENNSNCTVARSLTLQSHNDILEFLSLSVL